MAQSQPILGGYVPFYGTYIQVVRQLKDRQTKKYYTNGIQHWSSLKTRDR